VSGGGLGPHFIYRSVAQVGPAAVLVWQGSSEFHRPRVTSHVQTPLVVNVTLAARILDCTGSEPVNVGQGQGQALSMSPPAPIGAAVPLVEDSPVTSRIVFDVRPKTPVIARSTSLGGSDASRR
jgi:hypothetical protein